MPKLSVMQQETRGINHRGAGLRCWATDCSYLRVVGWGYYYLVTVMDDFSHDILGWELKRDMTASSLIDVVQQAVDFTGMSEVQVKGRFQRGDVLICTKCTRRRW